MLVVPSLRLNLGCRIVGTRWASTCGKRSGQRRFLSGYDLLKRVRDLTGDGLAGPAQPGLRRTHPVGPERADRGHRYRRPQPPRVQPTDAGHAELWRWLTEPNVDIAYHSAALVRVFFPVDPHPRGRSRDVARRSGAHLAALETICDTAEWIGDPVQVCGWLALEFCIRGSRNSLEWAKWPRANSPNIGNLRN
jgi:hypothetical protein